MNSQAKIKPTAGSKSTIRTASRVRSRVQFDHKRFDKRLYNDLQTPKHCMLFMDLVRDYTDHIRRADPAFASFNDATSLEIFTKMIDEDPGWGLARQVVPEFRESLSVGKMAGLSDPLRRVVESVQWRHNAHHQEHRIVTVPRRERELAWHRLTTQLSYLVPEEGHLAEAEVLAQRIARAGG